MKCANCGAEIKLGCVYCSVCGKEAQIVPDYNVEEDILKELLERSEYTLVQGSEDVEISTLVYDSRKIFVNFSL